MTEEKKLKISVDFGSSLKFWFAFFVVQVIAMLIAMAVLIGILGLIIHMLPGMPPLTIFIVFAQSILGIF
ncbi:MAG: hypothetical protein QXH24_00580 [Candidatus Bathyarchaeia archaeon]